MQQQCILWLDLCIYPLFIIFTVAPFLTVAPYAFPKGLHLGRQCRATYWCSSNTQIGTLKWLKVNNGTLTDIIGRAVTSVTSIADREISTSLLIDDVRDSDTGWYACMLTTPTRTHLVSNYVELVVSNGTSLVFGAV